MDEWTHFFERLERKGFLGMDDQTPPRVLAETAINRQIERYGDHGFGHIAAFRKSDQKFIGMCGLVPRDIEGENEMEIGYALIQDFHGKGYATEMAVTMLDWCIQNLDYPRYISMIHPENERSKEVAKRNGMKFLFESTYENDPIHIFGTSMDS